LAPPAASEDRVHEGTPPRRAFTFRSLVLGLCMVAFVNILDPYSKYILHSSLFACDYMPLGVVLPFLIVVGVVNVIWGLVLPGRQLARGELLIVFIMGLVGSTIPTFGLTGYMISCIASPFYFASPENQWEQHFHAFIPRWICPNDMQAMRWFFDGLPPGRSIPWRAWFVPLAWWMSFAAALFFVCFCVIVVLRKQWVERERLVFPLTELPIELTQAGPAPAGGGVGNPLPPLMRQRLFWIGFAVPMVIIGWNMISYFYPLFPMIDLNGRWLPLARNYPPLFTRIYIPVLAFAFISPREVTFSIWFFHLLAIIQVGLFNTFGFDIGRADVYCSQPASISWQEAGAFAAMVFWGLWMARSHLKDVLKKAIFSDPSVDDSMEMLSYRLAVFGGIAGLVYMVFWLLASGMELVVVGTLLAAVFVIYIGVTRVVVEGGLVFMRGPIIAQTFTFYTLGVSNISAASMTALAFSYGWFCDIKSFFMAAVAHSAKVCDIARLSKKDVLRAVVVAVVAGVAVSVWYTLYLGYTHGAYNFGDWIFRGGATAPFDNIVTKMKNPFGPDRRALALFGIGAAAMTPLIFLRYRFVWWPLHPVGFAVAMTLPVTLTAFSIFLAWLTKTILLRLGGLALYQKARPFFFGMLAGFFIGCGISFVVDFFGFPEEGHFLYGW
jgi:hypothetical protein